MSLSHADSLSPTQIHSISLRLKSDSDLLSLIQIIAISDRFVQLHAISLGFAQIHNISFSPIQIQSVLLRFIQIP